MKQVPTIMHITLKTLSPPVPATQDCFAVSAASTMRIPLALNRSPPPLWHEGPFPFYARAYMTSPIVASSTLRFLDPAVGTQRNRSHRRAVSRPRGPVPMLEPRFPDAFPEWYYVVLFDLQVNSPFVHLRLARKTSL